MAAVVISLAAIVLLVVGCTEGKKSAAGSAGPGGSLPAEMVVAKVGDSNITLGDLLFSFQVLAYLEQGVIEYQIYTQEARKRGVYPSAEKIDEAFKKGLEGQGGEENLMKQIPAKFAGIPKELIMQEFRKGSTTQLLQQAIAEDIFIKEKGDPTQDEVNQMFTQMGDGLKGQVATEKGIKPEEVTVDMALPKIKEALKQRWMGENAQKFIEELVKSYQVKNYILDQIQATMKPVKEDVQVPEMPKSGADTEESIPSPDATPETKPGGGN